MVSSSTGTSLVGLGFQSGYTDSVSGLVNMGVRSYSAGYGRFTAPDVVTGAVSNPGSFNRFLYANGSPVNATDPTGYWPDGRKAAAAALKGLADGIGTVRGWIGAGAKSAADWLGSTQAGALRFGDELAANPARALTNLMGGIMFGAASFAIDMVGSVGYLIQMAGTWTNNRTFTDIGMGVQTGAAALGDGLTQVTAATFDTSSGAFQTGRTYVDTMLVVDVGIGLVKAAVPILKLAAAGVKALRLGIQAVTKIAYTGTKALIRAGRRAAATLLEDGWTAFKRIFEKAEGASPSVKAATAGDEAFHYTSTKWLMGSCRTAYAREPTRLQREP